MGFLDRFKFNVKSCHILAFFVLEKTFSDSHYDLKQLANVINLKFSHIEMCIKSSQYKYKFIKKNFLKPGPANILNIFKLRLPKIRVRDHCLSETGFVLLDGKLHIPSL